MKKCTVLLSMLIVFFSFGEHAFAKETDDFDEVEFAQEAVDCDCEKGGLGLKIENFSAGVGYRTFNCLKGCDNFFGIGVGLGGESSRSLIGFGYNDGVIALGINFIGSEKARTIGIGIGYDYGDCRLVWPYEE